MAYTPSEAAYKLAFEISPITLTGGIASNIVGGALSVMSLLQAISYSGILSGGDFALDNAFANFRPLPGAALVENQIGMYPFANLTVAANCIIAQPLSISLLMHCPCKNPGDYPIKTAIMTALQNTLDQHNKSGGLYNVATPSFFYTNVILVGLHDVTGGEGIQAQTDWKWDFIKPLVSVQDAGNAQNQMMSRLSSGAQTNGALFGTGDSVGNSRSVTAPSVSPPVTASASASVPGVAQ